MAPFLLFLANGVFILVLLLLSYWHGRSARRLLRRAQAQVADLEGQAMAKVAELQASYSRILQEIDERRQAEARLRESESRFAAFIRNVPGAAVILEEQGTYLEANETWEKTFGAGRGSGGGAPWARCGRRNRPGAWRSWTARCGSGARPCSAWKSWSRTAGGSTGW